MGAGAMDDADAEAGVGANVADKGKGKAHADDDVPVDDAAAVDEDGGIKCQGRFTDYPFICVIYLFAL